MTCPLFRDVTDTTEKIFLSKIAFIYIVGKEILRRFRITLESRGKNEVLKINSTKQRFFANTSNIMEQQH